MADDTPIEVDLLGPDLLSNPLLNKGTAFTESERDVFHLHGFLPPHIGTLEDQISRRLAAFRRLGTNFERYVFLRGLQDNNETLFYGLITQHLAEMLPIVYTPTVGEGCQRYSQFWARPRGIFLSWPQRERISQILSHPRFDQIEAIVVSDGERILGLGDQGAGGMGIPIGKLALYTACAGLHPATTLPVVLDTGTNNPERIADPIYIGWRHDRIRDRDYDDFVEIFVAAVEARWPRVLLQWEDFARANAGTLLARYRDRLCTFNDDIQGTAAVAAGTLLAAVHVTGVPLREQRIALVGAGSAGRGIGTLILHQMVDDGLSEKDARGQFFAIDRDGLIVRGMPGILDFQQPFAQPPDAVSGWQFEHPGRIGLHDVVMNARPTVLIGVSGQAGIFSERTVRAMADAVARPVIFPLSNPVSRSEATPQDLDAWTGGRAVIGTGSPFPPIVRNGKPFTVDQPNNAYIFPGVGLGVIAVRARRVSEGMFKAAARALADLSPVRLDPAANLLPPVQDLRRVAVAVARAVARQARDEGLCRDHDDATIDRRIAAKMWTPVYRPYRRRGERAS
ncbi:MAG TPA: NAD-dependent malic enzyme [Xanthobacteraceae bacterium]|jgi:malate dehydrogenase (oxaloacetate-decarboxylating)